MPLETTFFRQVGRALGDRGHEPWWHAAAKFLRQLSIPLLDPSSALAARLAAGDPVYRDHWTPAGHEVIAAELSAYLERMLAGGSS